MSASGVVRNCIIDKKNLKKSKLPALHIFAHISMVEVLAATRMLGSPVDPVWTECRSKCATKYYTVFPLCFPGWSTSLVLENARLKVEAFEYLQLPFNIREGCIGRLEIQVHPQPRNLLRQIRV